MKPTLDTSVYNSDYTGGDFVVADVNRFENPLNDPAPLPKGGADSIFSVPKSVMVKAAYEGTCKELMLLVQLKFDHPGKAALPKSEVKGWKGLVRTGYAREGRTHIHLKSFNKRGLTVKIKEEWLSQDPNMIVFMVLQAYKLRCLSLSGRTRGAQKRNRRLVANENSGGVCLDMMAEMFRKTKQWASWMRKRIEKAGWAVYSRRWVECSEADAYACKMVGEGGRVSRAGKREVASQARLMVHPHFKWSFRRKTVKRRAILCR